MRVVVKLKFMKHKKSPEGLITTRVTKSASLRFKISIIFEDLSRNSVLFRTKVEP